MFAPSTNYIRTAHCASCSRSVRGTVLECDVCRILVHPACAPNTLHNCQSLTPIPALLPPLPFHSHPALAPFDLNAPPGGRSKGSTAEEGLEPSAMQGGLTATLKGMNINHHEKQTSHVPSCLMKHSPWCSRPIAPEQELHKRHIAKDKPESVEKALMA